LQAALADEMFDQYRISDIGIFGAQVAYALQSSLGIGLIDRAHHLVNKILYQARIFVIGLCRAGGCHFGNISIVGQRPCCERIALEHQ
jgi:hypothetical protein